MLFRSYGAIGYPDLNRRPERPSGLDYMVFETPNCQMIKENTFELAIYLSQSFDANKITNQYIDYACDILYYQKQDFDKSLHPIAFFPTNPLKQVLPQTYNFLYLENRLGSFGSIVASELSNSYILRIYNSELHSVDSGNLKGYNTLEDVFITDFEESTCTPVQKELPLLQKGELRVLKLNKTKKKGERNT